MNPHNDGFMTLRQLEIECKREPQAFLVEDLLPAVGLSVGVGDSGLGKTALFYQLGICVAEGIAFLGHRTIKGCVLYLDLENGRDDILSTSQNLCGFLGNKSFPENFLVCPGEGREIESELAIATHRPSLVIVDTLRALNPHAESNNERMGAFLKHWNQLAQKYQCSILLLHHVRKSGENGRSSLRDTPTLQWLEEAAGARAFVNQTHTRIAFDYPGKSKVGMNSSPESEPAFLMKAFVKMKGESGLLHIARVYDTESAEPIGYRRMIGPELLNNSEQESSFGKLPKDFTFKEAKQIYGRSDDPTNKWLKKCEASGIVKRLSKGKYERTYGLRPGEQAIESLENPAKTPVLSA